MFPLQNGIDWIVAIQSLGNWLEWPMRFFSLFRGDRIFLLVVPLLYWSVDAGLGLRVALTLATSDASIELFKPLFAAPRPYWISARVKPLQSEGAPGSPSGEGSFGMPSGHAQDAAVWSGMIAAWFPVGKRWAWIVAFALTFFIGFSRLYLGVHFPQDVLAGWLIGYIILFAFLRFWDPVAAWLKTKTLLQQALIAFAISLMIIAIGVWATARLDGYVFPVEWRDNALRAGGLPNPDSMEGIVTSAGSFFGLAAGAAWLASQGGYQASGPVAKRVVRYVLGLVGIGILRYGLGSIFPHGETLVPLTLLYIRQGLLGFWLMAGAPWLFLHCKLADTPPLVASAFRGSGVRVEMNTIGKKW